MSQLPEFIYKYQKIDLYSLRNLKNAQIYFNAPQDFNDPLEIILKSSLSETDYAKIIKHYEEEKSIKNFRYTTRPDLEKQLKESLKKLQRDHKKNIGCWCASGGDENNLPTNILMWSHYADSHKGICLAFRRSSLEQTFLKGMRSVSYDENPILSCPLCIINACECSDIFDPMYRKFRDWEYENEIRILHQKSNHPYGYQPEALEAIYFGLQTNKTDIENICLIIQGQNRNVKLFETFQEPNSYKVGFRQIYYESYLAHRDRTQKIT